MTIVPQSTRLVNDKKGFARIFFYLCIAENNHKFCRLGVDNCSN